MVQRAVLIVSLLVMAWVLMFAPAGCTSPERAAQETFELAQFEEKQGNLEHARKLYQDVTSKYPDTSWAEKARARLSELQPPPPSPPAE